MEFTRRAVGWLWSTDNRVAVTTPLVLQCVNGPAETVIEGNPTRGDSAVRCVYLANGATLSGFTLAAGATRFSGTWTRTKRGWFVVRIALGRGFELCIGW